MSRASGRVGALYDWWGRHPLALRLLYAASFLGRESAFRATAETALELETGDTVLEVGCGPGNSFESLRRGVDASGTVVGIDVSHGMVQRSRSRVENAGWSNVGLVRADATALPIRAESTDVAYSSMALSAMPDPESAIREVYRCLKPGGRFVVLDARPLQEWPWWYLNPLLVPLSRRLTNWVTDVDIPRVLGDMFDSVSVETFTAGAVFIATATKRTDHQR